MQATTDEVLIGRIANGDRLAMQVLHARHHARVFRFVVRLIRDEATAEDLISEVFLDIRRQPAGSKDAPRYRHGCWRSHASRLVHCHEKSVEDAALIAGDSGKYGQARDWQSNSRRRASIEVGHEHDQ
jgi:hypothetical protein